jgi:hypothetical protein
MKQIKFYITVNIPDAENICDEWGINDAQYVLEDCFNNIIKQYGFELEDMEVK